MQARGGLGCPAGKFGHGRDQPRAAVTELLTYLAAGQQRVDSGHHAAGPDRAVDHYRVLRDVGAEDRHHSPALQALRGQPRSERLRQLGQLRECQDTAGKTVNKCGRFTVHMASAQQEIGERYLGDGHFWVRTPKDHGTPPRSG